jgi:hypothetical protein
MSPSIYHPLFIFWKCRMEIRVWRLADPTEGFRSPQSLQANARIGHDRFLPYPVQPINHCYPTNTIYATDSVVNLTKQVKLLVSTSMYVCTLTEQVGVSTEVKAQV